MSSNSKRMRSIPMVAEDRISNLPDEILCHILSSLPSKLAASTIILSKRWKPLWFSVRSLDFEDLTFTDISSAMFSRDFTTTPILSFRFKRRQCIECLEGLECGDSYTFALNICLYISYLSRRLENLDLDLSGSLCRKDLPSCVFNCRTLVVLKLKKVAVFHLPQVDFPRLKTLHLNQVCFQRYQDVTKFLYGCPILENLQTKVLSVIDSNGLVSMEKFEAIPNLIKAKISDQFIPAALVREAKFLQANLTIRSFPVDQFPMFHNLTHMELFFNYTTCSSYKRKWNWLIQVLEHCPKLQHLIIHEDFADGNKSWKDPPLVPECLSSELRRCSLRSCNSMDSDQLQFAEYIVQNSKVLETMIIKTDRSLDMLIKSSSWTKCSATCKLVIC